MSDSVLLDWTEPLSSKVERLRLAIIAPMSMPEGWFPSMGESYQEWRARVMPFSPYKETERVLHKFGFVLWKHHEPDWYALKRYRYAESIAYDTGKSVRRLAPVEITND